jgi:hypothetical protein
MTAIRTHMLLGCAVVALAAAPGLEEQAAAQAFNANPAVRAGSVTFDRTTPGLDVVTVNTPSAVVDWRLTASPPFPDPITFLPAGNTGIFQNLPGGGDFAILNRIVPIGTSRIRMDGRVVGQLQTAAGNVPGGTIVFSSPTGIIVGRSAVFDVGNLMLTTLDPVLDGNDEFSAGGFFTLRGGENFPTAAIVTEAGSQFNAPAENSWVAMVAPRVDHNGGVRVNGSAAYVGGEQVDIFINQGLFDIAIVGGTTDANGVVHRGSTGGPASGAAGDNHVIYLAAAPQNQAISLLLTGNAGFDSAVSASVENGTIVLSAGHDVRGTAVEEFQRGTGAADFRVPSGTYTSDVTGRASRDFVVGDAALGTVTFRQDLAIAARNQAHLVADQGFVARVEGNANISAANLTPVAPAGGVLDITGGDALIRAGSGSRVEILGSATVDASARGDTDDGGIAGTGTGGRAAIVSDKGNVDISGSAAVLADGTGGMGGQQSPPTVLGAAGSGGNAFVEATNGGVLRVGGTGAVSATGTGSGGTGAVPVGASGTGGTARITATGGGAVTMVGASTVTASGTGGDVATAGAIGGAGQGGNANLLANGGTLDVTGGAALRADGTGGSGAAGGAGRGGTARIDAVDGRITSVDALSVESIGIGGGAAGTGGRGGDGSGGDALILAHSGAAGSQITSGSMGLRSSGTGGSGGAGAGATPGGRGGDGRGGTVAATAESVNGRIQTAGLRARSTGTGGTGGAGAGAAGGHGGDGRAGSILVGTVGGQIAGPVSGRADFASLDLITDGTGGNGGAGAPGGNGGEGTSGPIELVSTGAPVSVAARADLVAGGTGGTGGTGLQAPASGGGIAVRAVPLAPDQPGDLSVGNLVARSFAVGAANSLNVLGRWQVVADRSTVQLGAADFSATATGTPTDLTPSDIRPLNGTITIGTTGRFASQSDVRLGADGTGQLRGGAIALVSGRDVTIAHANRPAGLPTIDAATLLVQAARNYAAAAGTAVVGRGGIDIQAGGNATLFDTAAPTGALNVAAVGDVAVNGPAAGQTIAIAGRDVAVAAAGSVGNAATATVLVQAARDYSAAVGSSVRGGNVDLRAGRDASVAATNAGDQLAVTAGGLARIQAPAIGREVRVTSADIDVTAAGRVGDATTDLAALRVQPNAAATTIGGAAPGPGYTLIQDEANRVRGDTVRVEALAGPNGPGASSRIVVRDLAFSSSGAAGGINRLEIVTPGTVRVDGALLLGSAGGGDAVSIGADRLEVSTDAGSLRVRDAAGAPAGSLAVAAGDIWVADSNLLGQLAGDPNFAGRDEALRTNNGADRPRGLVEAGGIRLAPTRTLFVQNSGTAASFAGLTVGGGALEIDPSGNSRAVVNAFGRRLNPDGTFTTNIPFFLQVDFNRGDSAGYTNESEFNRCIINTGFCGGPIRFAPRPDYPRLFPLPPREPPGDPLDESDFLAEPLIEEPVTSGADSTLWADPDDDDDDEDEDEDEDEEERP